MSKKDKLLLKAISNPSGLSFEEFKNLLQQLSWVFKRQSGSHAIWHSTTGYRLVIQDNNGKAKGYQVKQFLAQVKQEQT